MTEQKKYKNIEEFLEDMRKKEENGKNNNNNKLL